MNLEKLTIKAQTAIEQAITIAKGHRNQAIETGHILTQLGARPIKRIFQKQLLNELSKQILAGKIRANSKIEINADNQNIVFKNMYF